MDQAHDSGFVEDGCQRAHDAIEPAVRAQVEQEYADRLETASLFQRHKLRRELNKEIHVASTLKRRLMHYIDCRRTERHGCVTPSRGAELFCVGDRAFALAGDWNLIDGTLR